MYFAWNKPLHYTKDCNIKYWKVQESLLISLSFSQDNVMM